MLCSQGMWSEGNVRMRSLSAVVRCSSSSGVVRCCRCNASTGQPICCDAAVTTECSCFLRFHCCVGCRVLYGRFVRATGVWVATACRFCALMHDWCALPAPYGRCGPPFVRRPGQSSQSCCPSESRRGLAHGCALKLSAQPHAQVRQASISATMMLGHAGTRTHLCI